MLGLAVATAVAAGTMVGGYLKPSLYERPSSEDAVVLIEDPGLSEWRAVIADLGGLGATFVVPINLYGQPTGQASAYAGYDQLFEREMARLDAEIDAQMRAAALRHDEWAREAAQGRLDRLALETRSVDAGRAEGPAVRRYTGYGADPSEAQGRRYTSYPTEPQTAGPDVRRYSSYPAEPTSARPTVVPGQAAPADAFTIVEPSAPQPPPAPGW